MTITILRDARVLDPVSGDYREGVDVLVETDRIREVSSRRLSHPDARVLDLTGRVLMPGLIDAHVHAIGVTLDLRALASMPPYLVAAQAKTVLEGMLMRGFTTVRDAGGAEWGLAEAVAQGHFAGPRLFVSGLALSQTGGHGDFRHTGEAHLGCPACAGLRTISRVVDGVDEVRHAVREQIRAGAHQIKLMASGGMVSNTPLDRPHFSSDELKAAVDEAGRCGTYVMAHAYEGTAVKRCLEAGVRSIEHGSLLDRATVEHMKRNGAYLVPTLSVYEAFRDHGRSLGLSDGKIETAARLLRGSLETIERAKAAGVGVGHGSDLEGRFHPLQSREILLKSEVMRPVEVIASMTAVNAELLQRKGELGLIGEGAFADLLAVEGDPTRDLGVLADPQRNLKLIMKGGVIYKNALRAGA